MGEAADCGPKRRENGPSSPGGAASIGPSALDRTCSTTRSSVRSRCIIRLQPSEPQRQHCRPPARFDLPGSLCAASVGQPPSLWVACWRIWLM